MKSEQQAGVSPARPAPVAGAESPRDAELWQALRQKAAEIAALVARAAEPREARDYVLGHLPKQIEYVFEMLYGRAKLRESITIAGPARPTSPRALRCGAD